MVTWDFTAIGHITKDEIILRDERRICLGGSPIHSSLVAKVYVKNVLVVSKVGKDLPLTSLKPLQRREIEPKVHWDYVAETTRFLLKYDRDFEREVWLKKTCSGIELKDIASFQSRVTHFGSVAHELSGDLVRELATDASINSLDLQGFTRSFAEDGTVRIRLLEDTSFLKGIDVIKAAKPEALVGLGASNMEKLPPLLRRLGPEVAIVTDGKKGLYVVHGRNIHFIPAHAQEVLDPTGAGDATIAAFMLQYLNDEEIVWSAVVAAAAASLTVEQDGPWRTYSAKEIDERAGIIEERVERIA